MGNFAVVVRGAAIAAFVLALFTPLHLDAQDGTAKLKVLGGVPGAVIRVNGQYVDRLPMRHAASVQPGTLFVEIEADGYRTYRETVDVLPRTRKRLQVTLVPDDRPSAAIRGAGYAGAAPTDPQPGVDEQTGFGMRTVSVFDLKRSRPASRPADTAPGAPAGSIGRQRAAVATAPAATPVKPATADGVSGSVSGYAGRVNKPPAPPASVTSAAEGRGSGSAAGGATSDRGVERLLPEDTASEPAVVSADTGSAPYTGAPGPDGSDAGEGYRGEREDDRPDNFDPFNIDIFAGYSYLFMVLGHEEPPTAEEAQSMSQQEIDRLANATPADLVDDIQGPGMSTGAAAWLRYNPLWLGLRLGYATYDPAAILTLMGELGMRFQGRVVEAFFGFGLGSGWLYGVSPERISADSGLALKFGLGLNFFVARDVAFGLSLDAVGLFFAGRGISPSQIGDFDPATSDHPIGIQLPIALNLGLRT